MAVRSRLLDLPAVSFIREQDLTANGRLFREFDFLKTLGKIPPASDWDSVRNKFDSEIISEVMANPGTYELDKYDYRVDGDSDE